MQALLVRQALNVDIGDIETWVQLPFAVSRILRHEQVIYALDLI